MIYGRYGRTTEEAGSVMNYTYILLCKDGTLYTGWTNDLKKRVKAHNLGKGAKYTKSRRPVKLVYYEEFPTKKEAMKREYTIKRMGRKEKERMIGMAEKEEMEKAGTNVLFGVAKKKKMKYNNKTIENM